MEHSLEQDGFFSEMRAFGELLDGVGMGLLIQSATANLMVNAAALRILDVDEQRLLDMPPGSEVWQAAHPDGRRLLPEEFPVIQALQTMQAVSDVVVDFTEQGSGRRRRMSVNAVPCLGVGQTRGDTVFSLLKEIGNDEIQPQERSGGDREKAQADLNKDDFLIMLSHEMRTPLNGIMGMLQLALHTRNRASIQEYLSVALESSKHLLHLLSDISEIAGSAAASLKVKNEPFEPAAVIYPTANSFAGRARSKGLEIFCGVDPHLPKRLVGDAGRIRQILFNLLATAVKNADKGEISVHLSPLEEHDSAKRHGLHILLRVDIDSASTKMENLFSSFDERDDSASAAPGAGLGFAIVKHLVRLLGGDLTLAAKKSEVVVCLPLSVAHAAESEDHGKESGGAETAHVGETKVLVVEDEPINLKTMVLSLELLGCKVTGVDSAYKGLALVRREKFDVVIMDIQMPGLDGLEATRLIRSDASGLVAGIPIVAITAHAMQGDKERILKAGVNEYIAKPVYLEQLRSVLSKVLKRSFPPFPID